MKYGVSAAAAALCLGLLGATAASQELDRFTPEVVELDELRVMRVTTDGQVIFDEQYDNNFRGGCSEIATYTDPGFPGGQYIAQAGFAENETAAVSYTLPPSAFPIKIDLMQMLFVTAATTESTTTEWSVIVWDGLPNSGQVVASFSSDDVILPHLEMPPGNNGALIQVSVDPGDPDQIIITNASGTNTFSVGFRVDQHNAQSGTGCLGSFDIPSNRNAFPASHTLGLFEPTNNWIDAINCGILGCANGWSRFSQLGVCTPSGDWAMATTWSSLDCTPGFGACCLPDGTCDVMAVGDCNSMGGTYQGDNTTCADAMCIADDQACCFESTGGCLQLNPDDCVLAGGVPGGVGSNCTTTVCFPEGACCLPDGSCEDGLSPAECAALNGTFQGDGSTCATVDCPAPTGACCLPTGACLVLNQDDCAVTGGTWSGPGTDCADGDGNGTADACESDGCVGDYNDDDILDFFDVQEFLADFAAGEPSADINEDGAFDFFDVQDFLAAFSAGCP